MERVEAAVRPADREVPQADADAPRARDLHEVEEDGIAGRVEHLEVREERAALLGEGVDRERAAPGQPDREHVPLARGLDVPVQGVPGEQGGRGVVRPGGGGGGQPDSMSIPAEFRRWLGRFTTEQTVPRLREFLQAGGTIITIGSSTHLARQLGLPVENHLVENGRPLPREKFFVPGSVIRVRVDNTQPIAYGMAEEADVFFDESPVFTLEGDAAAKGVKPVAWFDSPHSLRSGWAWGQAYLDKGVAIAEATVGKGKLYLFGPEITFRAQPHGTFKFLFNGIYADKQQDRVVQ